MSIIWCAVLLLCSYTASASEILDANQELCKESFSGHFIDTARMDTLILQSKLIHDEQHAYTCAQGFMQRWDWSKDLRLLYQAADSQEAAIEVVDAGKLNYSRISIDGICRDPDTKLDQMVFSRSRGGTAWGDRKNILFVYYDQENSRFASLAADSRFVDGSCSLQSVQKQLQAVQDKRESVRAIYLKLQPPKTTAKTLGSKVVAFDFDATAALFEKLNTPLPTPLLDDEEHDEVDSIDVAEFHLETEAENEHWRIISLYYQESVDNSWGVMLMQNKHTGVWQSFYDVPNEGSSKRYLFLPGDMQLDGDQLHLSLCTDCSWWGEYAFFQVNLNTFAYQKVN